MSKALERLRMTVEPAHTVVITNELQKGIVGDEAILAALPVAVREAGILPVAGRVCAAARARGVRVLHAVVEERFDGAGQSLNCRIFALGAKRRAEVGHGPIDAGRPGAEIVDELDVQPADIKMSRIHGMTAFTGTELDAVVRNLGGRTVVIMGVSVNLGVLGTALSACDLGYQVVIVRDAVCGIPKEYADSVLENSLSMIATIVDADELIAAWS